MPGRAVAVDGRHERWVCAAGELRVQLGVGVPVLPTHEVIGGAGGKSGVGRDQLTAGQVAICYSLVGRLAGGDRQPFGQGEGAQAGPGLRDQRPVVEHLARPPVQHQSAEVANSRAGQAEFIVVGLGGAPGAARHDHDRDAGIHGGPDHLPVLVGDSGALVQQCPIQINCKEFDFHTPYCSRGGLVRRAPGGIPTAV